MAAHLDQLLTGAGGGSLQTGQAGAALGPSASALPPLQTGSLSRLLSPEIAQLLSLTPADWAALLAGPPPPAAPAAEAEQPAAPAGSASQPATPATPAAPAQQAAAAKSGAGSSGGAGGAAQAPASKAGRKRVLSPLNSGAAAEMEGVEGGAAP